MAMGTRTRVKPPATFTAVSANYDRVTVSWSASSTGIRVAAYNLYRSTDGVTYTLIASTTALTYSDTGLQPSTQYLYQLQVQDQQGHLSAVLGAGVTTDSLPTGQASVRRYAAGHYVALSTDQMGTNVSGANSTYTGIPNPGTRTDTGPVSSNVKALVIRHRWNEINPTGTTYDYTRLDAEIAQAAAFPGGGVLIFWILVMRNFTGSAAAENPLPADLTAYSEVFQNTANPSANGWQTWRWSPTILDRFRTLVTKLGARYNNNVYFGGLATQETSVGTGVVGGAATTYTVNGITGSDQLTLAGYIAALQAESNYISTACPNARHMAYQNFAGPPGTNAEQTAGLAQYAATVQANEGIFGGPDLVLGGAIYSRCFPNYKLVHDGTAPVAGRGATMCAVQPTEWTNAGPPGNAIVASPLQRFNYGTGNTTATGAGAMPAGTSLPSLLNLDIIVWDWHTTGTYNFTAHAVPIFKANPSFGTYTPPVTGLTNYVYVDLNAVTNGNGLTSSTPTNTLPTVLLTANTTLLFNSDNGIQTIPPRVDCLQIQSSTVTIGSYGSTKAVISGFAQFTSGWTLVSGTVYQRTYSPTTGNAAVGCVINMSDTTGSAQGTVLRWTDMSTTPAPVPSAIGVGFYGYDYTAGVMYVNVGANPNTKTIGIAACERFISVANGFGPGSVTIQDLRMIGFSYTGLNIAHESNNWRVTRCEFYAIGGGYVVSATAPPGAYQGNAIQIAYNAHDIQIDNNLIEQTYACPVSIQHFSSGVNETSYNLSIHHNTIRYWGLAAFQILEAGSGASTSTVAIYSNIATGGGAGYSLVTDNPGLTDGVQLRGATTNVTGLNIHDNTIQAFDSNIAFRNGTTPGGVLVTSNRLSTAKQGILNNRTQITVTAATNQLCAHSLHDVNDVNQTPTTTTINGGTYSGNTTQAGQCYTPDLSTQGRQ